MLARRRQRGRQAGRHRECPNQVLHKVLRESRPHEAAGCSVARGGCNTLATNRVYDNVGNRGLIPAKCPRRCPLERAAEDRASIDRLRRRGQRLPADVEVPRRAPRDRRPAPGPRRVRQEGPAARPAAGGAGAYRGPDGGQDRRGGPGALHRAVDQRRQDQAGRPGRGRGVCHLGQARGSDRQCRWPARSSSASGSWSAGSRWRRPRSPARRRRTRPRARSPSGPAPRPRSPPGRPSRPRARRPASSSA